MELSRAKHSIIKLVMKNKSLMLSCTIDAEEQIDVATADIPGAFMQADMIGNLHVKLEG